MALAVIGFMGAGKTAAARAIAAELGVEAVDADEALEAELGKPIEAFWVQEGEPAFRQREEELIPRLLEAGGVVSLGGGAVESERVRDALAAHTTVWCRVDVEEAWRRSRDTARPLAADEDAFRRRFQEREPLYERLATVVLPPGDRELPGRAAAWIAALERAPGARIAWAVSSSGEYPAVVGDGALGLLDGAADRRWFVIADREVLRRHGGRLPAHETVIEVEGSEERKTLGEAERVLSELAAAGARRDDAVVAFGGGVTGDLAGYCAAVYQRGIPVVQVPTTLVGQVDSAYGGKTGVDIPAAKNYVGAFHQPMAVLADTGVLATLPPEEMAAGFVEVIKTALIAGGSLWERVRTMSVPDADSDPDELAEVIFACARTKIDIVAADERDSGRRAVLNLGHTVGHAIEAATGYGRYRHGEAVGLGLLAALRLSGADGVRDEVRGMLDRSGLPTSLDGAVGVDAVLDAVGLDKKRTREGLGFVLLDQPGQAREGQRVDVDAVRGAVEELRR